MCVDEVFTITHVEEIWENEEFSKRVHAKPSIIYKLQTQSNPLNAYMFIICLIEMQVVSKFIFCSEGHILFLEKYVIDMF